MSSRSPSCFSRPLSHRAIGCLKRFGRVGKTSAAEVAEDPPTFSLDTYLRVDARIILDASARRFQSKKIYLRAVAAVRWSNARNAILQSGKPLQQQAVLLQQATANLHTVGADFACVPTVADVVLSKELAAVTDTRIFNEFWQTDAEAGYWLQEDPPLATILDWLRAYPA